MSHQNLIASALFEIGHSLKKIKHQLAKQAELNASEFELLLILANSEEAVSIKLAAEKLLLCSQAVTKISKSLERKEFISFEKSQQDRRVTHLSLTPSGQVLTTQEKTLRQLIVNEALQKATDEEDSAAITRFFNGLLSTVKGDNKYSLDSNVENPHSNLLRKMPAV